MHNQLITLPCDLLLITIGYQLQMVAILPTLTLNKVVQLRRDATCNVDTVYCWLCRWKNSTVKSMMFVWQGSRPMFLPVCHDDVWFTCDLKHLPLDICALQLLGDCAIVFSAAPLCACDNCLQLFFIPYYMYTRPGWNCVFQHLLVHFMLTKVLHLVQLSAKFVSFLDWR